MNINSVKNINPGGQFAKRFLAILISLTIIIIAFMVLSNVNNAAKNTVDIVRVKSSDGIPAKTLITKDDIERYPIIQKEFTSDMVKYEEADKVIDKYSVYFLRGKTPVFKDQINDQKPIKNDWLYQLNKANEVLTIQYNYLECGGDILTPGDRIRIRVNYEEEDAQDGRVTRTSRVKRTDVLFNEIQVRDLLNSKGHSVYEVYKEVLKLSEKKRQEIIKGKEFMESIMPRALLLEATKEQIDTFARYKDKQDKSLTITILSRQGNKEVLDQLPALEKEIESWISKTN